MKKCLGCHEHFESELAACAHCGVAPVVIDGFVSYAPELAAGGGGFKAEYFPELARLEATNFWFRARNQLIVWAIRKYAPRPRSLLELGCGTGYVLAGIAAHFPEIRLTGTEVFVAGLRYAASRVPGARFEQMDARRVPYQSEFDVVGAFDVLEHIAEDESFCSGSTAPCAPMVSLC